MSAEDIVDIYLAREALETAAVRRITATSRAATAYKALDKIVRGMESAEQAGDWGLVAKPRPRLPHGSRRGCREPDAWSACSRR